ncbi:molybdenum cofactor biosynthesis protein MoaE [Niveispirillum sp. BGYR6]|uniref:molybdenum cofactor biosynthesis protein MoaE n=1 Tax=Niveispirillum sp. BGYR6 TaxID=2971249 RepID=UPI0022B95BC4|nr:molybdenum cofactor biosynthesis protein MoaE [Niveispirillum sp. BGYR6]MDG5495279.1 molybdenum cofactor biosynthesis protein MoaE [Niveispirillum sp. BGYR6]
MAVRVQQADFDIGAELTALTQGNPGIGGVCCFTGLVRDLHPQAGEQAGTVRALTLEHYPGMTERQLAAIEAEARARWPLEACLIIHRHGRMEPGEKIVLVACASAHREAAFDACRFLMDWLKSKAPFWKLEETGHGTRWVDSRHSDEEAARRWDQPAG